ncbi:hypothetical protein [Streptomyces sp. NPDC056405]|uniref:hypothetical protein n=1 Tax=Streptomyces sp. NPDC056405 TaxID=3345811 RepID=UPI0035D61210
MPPDDALHLIGALNAVKDGLYNAAQRWELLDENGHVPAAPSYTTLLQHAADAQDLSRDVLCPAAAGGTLHFHVERIAASVDRSSLITHIEPKRSW